MCFEAARQLPPATSKPPFIVFPNVISMFSFRCLHQDRRLVKGPAREASARAFHQILEDISYGRATNDVHNFVVQAYVRGAAVGCAENAELDGVDGGLHEAPAPGRLEPPVDAANREST